MSEDWRAQFPSGHRAIKKYRPYLSHTEMIALLNPGDSNLTHYLESAREVLRRTILMTNEGLNSPAYTTNPRSTLNERLGFNSSVPQPEIQIPDFTEMMKQITGGTNDNNND